MTADPKTWLRGPSTAAPDAVVTPEPEPQLDEELESAIAAVKRASWFSGFNRNIGSFEETAAINALRELIRKRIERAIELALNNGAAP
jgi:hypothetical protein